MGQVKIVITDVVEVVRDAFKAIRDPIAEAATSAVHTAGQLMKDEGRANIAAAGFSSKWQNTWNVKYFPARGVSIDAAAEGRHKIFYSSIFEDGGTIAGRGGLLWIPFASTPRIGRSKPTPRKMINTGVKLFSMHSAGGLPMLATSVRGGSDKPSLSKLRKGTRGKRGEVHAVPLFFGLDSVHISKKFNLEAIRDKAQSRIPELYAQATLNPGV